MGLITQYKGLKKEIYVLFVGRTVTAMGSFVWPMLTFFLTSKLGFTDELTALIIASATVVMLPASILGGKIADKFDRRKIILLFDCLTVSLYVLAAILPITGATAVIVFFAGLFQTIEGPAYDALTADFSASNDREKAYSLLYLGFNLGYIVGAALSGVLFKNFIELVFLLNGVSIFASTALIFLFIRMSNAIRADDKENEGALSEYERPVDEKLSIFKVLSTRKVVAYMLLVGCIASMPSSVVGILLPLQLNSSLPDIGAMIYGYLNSLNGLVVIIFTPILTVLLKKLTEIPKCAIGTLLFVAGVALFSTDGAVYLLFIGMFIFTIGEVTDVLGWNPYASRRVPTSHRGRIGGIVSVVYTLFSALMQYAISITLHFTNSNYRLVWYIFGSCGLAAVVFYLLIYGKDRRTFPALYAKK